MQSYHTHTVSSLMNKFYSLVDKDLNILILVFVGFAKNVMLFCCFKVRLLCCFKKISHHIFISLTLICSFI